MQINAQRLEEIRARLAALRQKRYMLDQMLTEGRLASEMLLRSELFEAEMEFQQHAPADVRDLLEDNNALRNALRDILPWIEDAPCSELRALIDIADGLLNDSEATE